MLLFEYTILGIRSRLYSSSDVTGRRAVIGPELRRQELAAFACRSLMDQGAEIVLLSLQTTGKQNAQRAFTRILGSGKAKGIWSLAEREVPSYLPLKKTLDETFATIGKWTRANLRRYRRKAEKDLDARLCQRFNLGWMSSSISVSQPHSP